LKGLAVPIAESKDRVIPVKSAKSACYMIFGICPLSVVSIRSSASHKSELVSQLLFGELFEVMERKGRQWLKVRCQSDNCVGWIAADQAKPVTPSEFAAYREQFAYSLELVQAVMGEDHFLPVTLGARLPNFDGLRFQLGEARFTFSGQAVFPEDIDQGAGFVLKIARRYLRAPFLWGGRSPLGIDSSGLVQVVYQMAGIAMPREPQQQVMVGTTVDFVEQARPGDLAFFENRNGRITHAGIILPKGQLIHACGQVRIDRVDHYGIYDVDRERYTHRLRLVKRVLPDHTPPPPFHRADAFSIPNQPELF